MFVIIAALASAAGAAQLKIGVVDINTVISQSDAGKAVNNTLQRYVENVRAELNAKQKVIDDLRQTLDSLSEEQRSEKLAEIETLESELQEAITTAQKDVDNRTEEYRRLVLEDIGKVLAIIAEEDGYHLIIDAATTYYYAKLIDITWEVIRKYNDLYEQALQAAQSNQ
ncbi:MAG TPA: OmpH family outer membrane protein [Firmicutes bacterium]|nr:OmpH family outer membrane protein [Bacillota bacterium]